MPRTALGRWLPIVGTVTLWWALGSVTQALAADSPRGEKEPRSEEVVVVRPDEAAPAGRKDAGGKIDELQRAVKEERTKKRLLELKLKSLKERVETEKRKLGQATATSSPNPTSQGPDPGRGPAEAVHSSENDDSQLVREYIWVPQHREGDKLVEGGYRLKVR